MSRAELDHEFNNNAMKKRYVWCERYAALIEILHLGHFVLRF